MNARRACRQFVYCNIVRRWGPGPPWPRSATNEFEILSRTVSPLHQFPFPLFVFHVFCLLAVTLVLTGRLFEGSTSGTPLTNNDSEWHPLAP
jgi:hypothetical protein